MDRYELGHLADPTKLHDPIDLRGEDPEELKDHLRMMLTIRLAEGKLAQKREEGVIGGPVHLGAGQEAVAVGVSASLSARDHVFGGHRSHSHVLALGSSVHGLFAEVLGKDTGLSRGMGGSMHLWDGPNGFCGSAPIVAGTVPLAVGAGLAEKLRGTEGIGVAYFGDGAFEEGAVQESLNLARILEAPVLFVVENNFFSSHMHIGLRQPRTATARFAQAHDLHFEIVDGNDVLAVKEAGRKLTDRARAGGGPSLIEAVTFRWYGHVDWREDIDVGVNRSLEDLANWRARDPIARLSRALESRGHWSSTEQDELTEDLGQEIDSAWEQAMEDPWPERQALIDRVLYSPTGA